MRKRRIYAPKYTVKFCFKFLCPGLHLVKISEEMCDNLEGFIFEN